MKNLLLSVVTLVLCACATTPLDLLVPYATAASRSDATVTMTTGALSGLLLLGNTPATDWDWTLAEGAASEICAAWGFDRAAPLSPVIRFCSGSNAFGSCAGLRYDRTYQCVDLSD